MIDGLKWHSKSGLWCSKENNDYKPENDDATARAENNAQVVDQYVLYLKNAKADADADDSFEGKYDFTNWNAKKLVWEMGNSRSLAAIRNAVYKFNDLVEDFKLDTLGSGPRITESKKDRIEAAKAKIKDRGWMEFAS